MRWQIVAALLSIVPVLAQVRWSGTGCTDAGNMTLAMRFRGLPSPGETVEIGIAASPATAAYTLIVGASDGFWGTNALPLDLSFAGIPGCMLYASPDILLDSMPAVGFSPVPIPELPQLLGRSIHVQALVADPRIPRPTPVATSDLLTLTLLARPALTAELIHSGPTRVDTPPSWNANLPKLAADSTHLYAVHTHFTAGVAARSCTILRRLRTGGPWVAVATIRYPQQLPGIVMDTAQRLHLVFNCAAPAGDCFQGGAGGHRFYHLIFGTRDGSGALRFDTYLNYDEWPLANDGYLGLGTAADGTTIWSLADSSWSRIPQWWRSGSSYGTFPALVSSGSYLLYPVTAAQPAANRWLMYFGEFVPGAGNAYYRASTAYLWDPPASGARLLFRETHPSPAVGVNNAFPADVAWDERGVLHVLSYLLGTPDCTWLRRYDDGLASPPRLLPVGCAGNYAKLQIDRHGTLYVLAAGAGATVRLGVSHDRGESWTWADIPIVGVPAVGDARYIGMTPVKPYTSPALYDPDVLRVFFSGVDAAGGAQHSYYGELALPY